MKTYAQVLEMAKEMGCAIEVIVPESDDYEYIVLVGTQYKELWDFRFDTLELDSIATECEHTIW